MVQEVLTNHGIESESVPVGTLSKYSMPTLRVREADYDRSAELIDKMLKAIENPPIAQWLSRCGEQIERQFDICWKCGKDKPTA